MRVLQVLLSALLPLLQRRVLAAERQAAAAEEQVVLLRAYLGYSDPLFAEILQGRNPLAEAASTPPDDTSEYGPERDRKAERLEWLRQFWWDTHGEQLDEERLVREYDRLYTEAEQRVAAQEQAVAAGGTH